MIKICYCLYFSIFIFNRSLQFIVVWSIKFFSWHWCWWSTEILHHIVECLAKEEEKQIYRDKTGHPQMQWLTLTLVSLARQFIFKFSVLCCISALNSKIVQFLQSRKPRSLVVPRLTLLHVGKVEMYPCCCKTF